MQVVNPDVFCQFCRGIKKYENLTDPQGAFMLHTTLPERLLLFISSNVYYLIDLRFYLFTKIFFLA